MVDLIVTEQTGPVLKVSLNRPDEGNIMTDEMVGQLADVIRRPAADVKVILLTGRGKDFCLGRDTSKLNVGGPLPEALALRHANEVIFDCYSSFRQVPIPVISAVQGRARGFGCALACAADMTLATSDAIFQLPEMSHGIMPGMAMSALIDRISKKHLLHLVYSGAPISADRALNFGLVTDVVDPAKFDAALFELVRSVVIAPIVALKAVKEYSRTAFRMESQGAMDFARNLHVTINSSSEIRAK